jgi:hypothetical protein
MAAGTRPTVRQREPWDGWSLWTSSRARSFPNGSWSEDAPVCGPPALFAHPECPAAGYRPGVRPGIARTRGPWDPDVVGDKFMNRPFPVDQKTGYATLPDGPDLGVEIDRQRMARVAADSAYRWQPPRTRLKHRSVVAYCPATCRSQRGSPVGEGPVVALPFVSAALDIRLPARRPSANLRPGRGHEEHFWGSRTRHLGSPATLLPGVWSTMTYPGGRLENSYPGP